MFQEDFPFKVIIYVFGRLVCPVFGVYTPRISPEDDTYLIKRACLIKRNIYICYEGRDVMLRYFNSIFTHRSS